ncbi:hypothetical protein HYS96_00985 [Candidatus Daviesbacteria bacterium]|nr:hypothetical protein [Candidatus Daviesbacteria bacterium]
MSTEINVREISDPAGISRVDETVGTACPIHRQGQSLNVVGGVLDPDALWFDGPDLELRPGIDVDWSIPQVGREESWAIED